jgi:alkaline phosphatase
MHPRLLLALGLFLSLWLSLAAADAQPKHVFLFIGDGMGEIQAEATERALAKTPADKLSFRTFPVQGWQNTAAANATVTDSAAAATAIACGVRTNNGMLGMTPDAKPVPSIATLAHERGWKVGILTSVSIDHATPAGFYAHDASRGNLSAISETLADSPFEFFGGGGMAGQKGQNPGEDNLQRAIRNGFVVARTRDALQALTVGQRVYAFNHRLVGGAALPWAIEAGPDDVTLAEFTAAAIRQLADSPFFIMVEGGKIDWSCHSNDLGTTIGETKAFDEAVKVAVEFAKANPDTTLIVVTGDHETGGLTRLDRPDAQPAAVLRQTSAGDRFSGQMKGLQEKKADLAEVTAAVQAAFGLSDLTEAEQAELKQGWDDAQSGVEKPNLYGKANPVTVVACRLLAARAGYTYTTGGHTGANVPVYALGVGADAFGGTYNNTEIFARLHRLMALDESKPAQE